MSESVDQRYLLTEQYRDSTNLDARVRLHAQFSTNKYGWHRWVLDHFDLPAGCKILELGCGPGYLWHENGDRIPKSWDITLSDFSPGMVQAAQQRLADVPYPFSYKVINAQEIPFEGASLDAVIANHMLYYVPDRDRAIAEIRRVLRPGGQFYATTVGSTHLRELSELARRFDTGADLSGAGSVASFLLENGAAQIARWFPQVSLCRYEDALVITEAEPLVAYILSSTSMSGPIHRDPTAFAAFVREELAKQGAIRVTKDSGLFVAQRDCCA
jgi:ubiquinone/menaquinone biosynthesis C-methylase UbiE